MDKKTIKNIIKGTALVLVVALLAMMPALARSKAEEGIKQSAITASAVRGDIEKKLIFAGSLSATDAEKATLPADVRVLELLAANGDVVSEGDPLAKVDRVSVMDAVMKVQKEIKSLERELQDIKYQYDINDISVSADGRIYVSGRPADKDNYSTYAEFLMLTESHREYEEALQKLFRVYNAGALLAPCDGVVNSVDKNILSKLAFYGDGELKVTFLAGDGDPDGTEPPPKEEPDPTILVEGVVGEVTDTSADITFADDTSGTFFLSTIAIPNLKTGDRVLFNRLLGSFTLIESGDDPVPTPTPTPTPSVPVTPSFDLSGLMGMFGGFGGGGYGGYSGSAQSGSAERYDVDALCVMTVIPQGSMKLKLTVDEQDVNYLSLGQTLDVAIDALPGQSFEGVIETIGNAGENAGGSSKFTVELGIDKTEEMLPGMNANASLLLASAEDCVLIPVAAVQEDSQGCYVYTAHDSKKDIYSGIKRVELGLSDGINVAVISGLNENDTVCYGYYDIVELSTKVK